MSDLTEYLYEKIKTMQTERAERKIEPNLVPFKSLRCVVEKDIRDGLNELYKDGRLSVHELVNDKGLSVVE